MITPATMLALSPHLGAKANDWADALASWCAIFAIDTPAREAMFLAQAMHESAGLTMLEENLDYSIDALTRLFPTHFNPYDVEYAHHPQAIANRLYANRLGNGDEASGDGWRYRGRGIFQVTGRANVRTASIALAESADTLLVHPELLAEPDYAIGSALWYWHVNGCNAYADAGNLDAVSDLINRGRVTPKVGDAIGYKDRLAWFDKTQELVA